MAFLLDTMALVAWWGDSPLLGNLAREILDNGQADVFVSSVSVWEIANKNRLGKLPQLDGFESRFPVRMADSALTILDLNADHAMRAGYLTGAHRDPFDRLIAGHALVEDLTVLTNDPQIAAFGCEVLW